MKQLHMTLQGKGGVGKSLVAAFLAQHFQSCAQKLVCIDTDPVNATLLGYDAFETIRLDLLDENDNVNARGFDELIEIVMSAEDDTKFVVDNGASSFIPLICWMVENDVVHFLQEADVEIILHSVITGGQALVDTMKGLDNLLKNFPQCAVVVWKNDFYGTTDYKGKSFEESTIFLNHQDHIQALISIPLRRKETFEFDLNQILEKKVTFFQAINDSTLNIMARQRLRMIWRDLNAQITAANF